MAQYKPDPQLALIVAKLDKISSRLDGLESKVGGGGGGHSSSGGGGGGGGGAGEGSESVVAFDALVKKFIPTFMADSKKIGGDIAEQAGLVNEAVDELRKVLVVAASSKKPSDAELPGILQGLSGKMAEVVGYRDSRRGHKQFDHLSTLSEGIAAFGWVSVSPTPGPFAVQTRAGSEFYSNKLLRLYKGKDDTQMSWINGFNGFLKEMEGYIKEFHRTGLSWTGSGTAKAAPAAAKKPAASKPAASKPALGGGGKPNFFAELSKGTAVTAGLKKVDKSQMTHKNPELRKGGKVAAPASASKPKRRGVPSGTPKFELSGQKWVIEFHDSKKDIVVEKPEVKHTVYMYGLYDCVVQIKGKVNQVTMDQCQKTSVVCTDVVAGIELVNTGSATVQITGKCPTISIEKVSGALVYLSKDCLEAQIVTAKSDAVNIAIPCGEEFTEVPVPEQFISKVTGAGTKKVGLDTKHVEHSG